MSPELLHRKLVAIASVDVAGYSRLVALDEIGTIRRLTEYRELIRDRVESHSGRVVDDPGDNALLEFPSATGAVQCAIEIQDEVGLRNDGLPADQQMKLRIGIHLGDVMVDRGRIYGDGVNVAARLEAIAPVSGIAVSKSVRDQAAAKIDADFVDMGERELKNISRPVHVFRLGGEAQQSLDRSSFEGASGTHHRAAWIAVLPFENLSRDPEQEYFADGLTNDVITALSAFRSLRVIARTSTFQYKGSTENTIAIGDELGVRFVLEGSVRKSGDRIRVSAQLVDASLGTHVWADRYDVDLVDVFDAQDQITRAIVVAIDPAIRLAETQRVSRSRPESLSAWDHVQRGWFEYYQFKPDRNREARREFLTAIQHDSNYAQAHGGLSWTHALDVWLRWSDDEPASKQLAYDEARTAISLDPRDAITHVGLAMVGYTMGRLETVRKAADEARNLNPSLATAYLMSAVGRVHGYDPESGVQLLTQAIELSPRDPNTFFFFGARSIGHFVLRDLDNAMADATRSFGLRYGYLMGRAILTCCLVEKGRIDEAKEEVARILEIAPGFTPERLNLYAFEDEGDKHRILDALIAAGMSS